MLGGRESSVEEEDHGNFAEQETKEDNDRYAQFLQEVRREYFATHPSAEERTPFDFERVTHDVEGFTQKLQVEKEERERAMGTYYEDNDADKLSTEFMDRHLAAFKADKETEEEFEEVWQGLTSDIYNGMRDELKGTYDQARLLMKLNQQLRMKIIHSAKQSKTLLNQTQKQKERLVLRIESHARDFQSDVIPKRVFDFIGH